MLLAVPKIKCRVDAERASHRLSALAVVIFHQVALRDRRISKLQEKAALVIEPAQKEIEAISVELEAWAQEHRAEEFGEGKTLELQCGVLSFRQGQRKLELRSGWTWERVLERLLEFPITSQWAEYVRRKPEVDCRKLLDDSKVKDGKPARLPEAKLAEIGLKVTQEERFEAAPKPKARLAEVPCP